MSVPHFFFLIDEPATGKSMNRNTVCDHFGCDLVFDGDVWDCDALRNARRVLVISNYFPIKDPRPQIGAGRGAKRPYLEGPVYRVAEMKRIMGLKWIYGTNKERRVG